MSTYIGKPKATTAGRLERASRPFRRTFQAERIIHIARMALDALWDTVITATFDYANAFNKVFETSARVALSVSVAVSRHPLQGGFLSLLLFYDHCLLACVKGILGGLPSSRLDAQCILPL